MKKKQEQTGWQGWELGGNEKWIWEGIRKKCSRIRDLFLPFSPDRASLQLRLFCDSILVAPLAHRLDLSLLPQVSSWTEVELALEDICDGVLGDAWVWKPFPETKLIIVRKFKTFKSVLWSVMIFSCHNVCVLESSFSFFKNC